MTKIGDAPQGDPPFDPETMPAPPFAAPHGLHSEDEILERARTRLELLKAAQQRLADTRSQLHLFGALRGISNPLFDELSTVSDPQVLEIADRLDAWLRPAAESAAFGSSDEALLQVTNTLRDITAQRAVDLAEAYREGQLWDVVVEQLRVLDHAVTDARRHVAKAVAPEGE